MGRVVRGRRFWVICYLGGVGVRFGIENPKQPLNTFEVITFLNSCKLIFMTTKVRYPITPLSPATRYPPAPINPPVGGINPAFCG